METTGLVGGDRMGEYTVRIDAGSGDGTHWRALAPPKITTGDSAAEVARWTATNQDVAEGSWRVRVWDGAHADTREEPAAEVYSNTF
jgi:hypothetical protein